MWARPPCCLLSRLRAIRRSSSSPAVARSSATDVSGMSNEELKKRLEYILGSSEKKVEDLSYQGTSCEELARQFNKDPFIEVGRGPGGFPFVILKHDSGCEAVVHLHGGTVSSWTDADGLEMLFTHPDNDFDPRNSIRGGLNVAFPQYAKGLPGLKHRTHVPINGFMGQQHFTLMATHCRDISQKQKDSCPGVTLHAASSPETEEVFPHQWEMLYQVNLMDQDDPKPEKEDDKPMAMPRPNVKRPSNTQEELKKKKITPRQNKFGRRWGRKGSDTIADETDVQQVVQEKPPVRPAQLQICMSIANRGDTDFQFQAATFADMAVLDMNAAYESVRLVGLGNRHAIDLGDSRKAEMVFNDLPFTHPIPLPDKSLNRVFVNTNDGDVYFCPGNRQYYSYVWRQGFSDTIVAHPGIDSEWTTCFARIGAGKIGVPVVLKPGQVWHAEFALRKHYHYWPYMEFEDYGTPLEDVKRV